ncbi:MAG: hypothetical protein LBP58_04255 [Azoarcus sp.]|jgi:type IV pilus assembly protein PilX|nr:hypothetical protein [Azoarcus sp.]
MNRLFHSRHQQGATLVVSIILLALMTLLATASLRTGIQEERISAAARDRDLAFQSAEAGLRIGEAMVERWAWKPDTLPGAPSLVAPPGIDNDCSPATPRPDDGLYAEVDPDCAPLWDKEPGEAGAFWHKVPDDSFATDGLSLRPYYIIEYISGTAPCNPGSGTSTPNCKRFRVTASSDTTDGRAAVMLQSIYAIGDEPPKSP